MRWDGDDWGTVSPTDETALYMEALMDLTEGAPLGTFTAVFCRTIAAQQAFINELQTKLIQVQNAIFGGARFVRNGDGSGVVDLGDDKTGFKLGADGQLIASGADISGTINANNGSFSNLDIKDVTISGNSVFKGDIISGPLELTSDYYISDIINYPDNSINEQYLVLSELSRFGIPNTNREYHSFNISGTYNGTTISRIMYHYDTVGGTDVRAWDTSMNLLTIKFGMSAAVGYNIIGDLSFRYTSDGKTFKLKSLPGQQGASGAVYKDANNFLRITP
jgi:hypothetical protein